MRRRLAPAAHRSHRTLIASAAALAIFSATAGCSSDSTSGASSNTMATEAPDTATTAAPAGVRVVGADEAASHIDNASPAVIDIRTPDEFASGHIDGATNIDFYAPDFADQISALDPAGDYVIYCRSGNRSGQARALFTELNFENVADIDGGIVAWEATGFPVVMP